MKSLTPVPFHAKFLWYFNTLTQTHFCLSRAGMPGAVLGAPREHREEAGVAAAVTLHLVRHSTANNANTHKFNVSVESKLNSRLSS